ncbi:protein kinase [Streptomyces sp. NPDC050485]|uniref:caspase, EACC1-associated type n=1 Tax=Streptomyces sp. NPDC050485 TaxID=3365617 RepID=UPI003798A2AA
MSPRDDIDFSRSRAILLGTSEYTAGFDGRRPMRAALHSLTEMRKVLTGPCEWPKSRITELPNQHDSGKLLRKITGLIGDVEDVLLFYYVGHGLPLPENGRYDLGLALTDTDDAPAHRALTSLRLRDLREVLAQSSSARIKVLVLDCCSSGIATKYGGPSSNLTAFADSATPARGAGTYVWAACGHSQETYYEDGKGGLTYFTKSLSEAVREAHDEYTPGATVAHLHDDLRQRLRSIPDVTVAPLPDLHYSGRPDQFLFVRGRAPVPPGPPFAFAPLENGDPRRIGPYDVMAKLGAGGAGRVYLAFTPARQAVAVKLLRPDLSQDPEFAQRFGREIELARRVRSSHVARVLDADAGASEPWLASSYVCGPSLHELVRENGPLPTRDVLLVTAGIARALEAVQAAGAVHRDLKPANVMLDETGPKLIDFGIAKSVAATLMTRTNVQLGTPAYKSPEQALGRREVTTASDVFTLGATVYYLATGRDAFEAEDPLGLINLIAHEEPDLDVLDDEVRGVVSRCLAKDPAARPTPTEVVQMCTDVTGPVATSAFPYITNAGPAINARAAALRTLAPPPPPPRTSPEAVVAPPRAPRTSPEADTEAVSRPKQAQSVSQSTRAATAAIAVVLCVLAAVLLPKLLHSSNTASGKDNSGASTSTTVNPDASHPHGGDTFTPSHDQPSHSPTDDPTTTKPTTPSTPSTPTTFDPGSLDSVDTDQTPLRPDALLPRTFTDSRGIVYNITGGGVEDCVNGRETSRVQNGLSSNRCRGSVVGTYTDTANHVLVVIQVAAMRDATAAAAARADLTDAPSSEWGLWCPLNGPGSQTCQNPTATVNQATQAGYIGTSHRYVTHTLALYINLERNDSVKPWVDSAALAASYAAGPQNYTRNR